MNLLDPRTWFNKKSGISQPTSLPQDYQEALQAELDSFNQNFTPIDKLLPRIREAISLANLRDSSYSSGGTGLNVPSLNYDKGNYAQLYKIFSGQAVSDMQVGGLIAQHEIEILTGLVIGELPKVVAYNQNSDTGELETNEKLTSFYNTFLNAEHAKLYEGVKASCLYGDCYFTVGFDRKLQVLAPYPADITPGFNIITGKLAQVIIVNKQTAKIDEETAVELTIKRTYNAKEIKLEVLKEGAALGVGELGDPNITITNGFKACPVFHLKNRPLPGFAFGSSEIMATYPFLAMVNNIIISCYESQKYHGKPTLCVTGITSTPQQWLQRTFGADPSNNNSSEVQAKVLAIFKQMGMLALSDDVKAEFLESKRPLGAATEVNDLLMQKLVQASGIPDFMWGHSVKGNNSTVREQYTSLDATLKLRKAELAEVIQGILAYATWYFSSTTESGEAGKKFPKLNLLDAKFDVDSVIIKLIWPGMLTSDEQLKLSQLKLLTETGNISQGTLLANMPSIIADPLNELKKIKSNPVSTGKETGVDAAKNVSQQKSRDDKGNNADNSGGAKT